MRRNAHSTGPSSTKPFTFAASLLVVLTALAGCGASGDDDTSPAGSGGSGGSSGSGGSGVGGSGGSTAVPKMATGLEITGVSIFQGLKVALAENGAPVATIEHSVIAGRKTLFRVYVQPSAGATLHSVTAELGIATAGQEPTVFTANVLPTTPTAEEAGINAIDIEVPAEAIVPGAFWSVRLLEPEGEPFPEQGKTTPARLPQDGTTAPLGSQADAGGVELVLVPMRYDYDGSGRLPDMSDAQIQRYRDLLQAVYPVTTVTITIHDPVPWDQGPDGSGGFDFDALNDALFDLRASENPGPRAYYYGLVNPATSFNSFCSNWCTTGQSWVVDYASDQDYRVGAGIGFTGDDSAWTLVHELGHMHGRDHAPCDVSPSDPGYPYSDGSIGVWGWDSRNGVFQDPEVATDFMGYCPDNWVSDYTWDALFKRVMDVNAQGAWHVEQPNKAWSARVMHVDAGGVRWGRSVTSPRTQAGGAVTVQYLDEFGTVLSETTAPVRNKAEGGGVAVFVPSENHLGQWVKVVDFDTVPVLLQ